MAKAGNIYGKAIFASKYNYTILTGLGVFVSTNKGASFTDYSTGLFPTSNVRALLVDSNFIYGGTDTRSVWMRKLQAQGLESFDDATAANEEIKNSFTATAINPFKNKIEIQLYGTSTEKIVFYLYNSSGKIILQKEIIANKGKTNVVLMAGNNLRQGVYVLEIIQGRQRQTLNLIKQ